MRVRVWCVTSRTGFPFERRLRRVTEVLTLAFVVSLSWSPVLGAPCESRMRTTSSRPVSLGRIEEHSGAF